MDKEKTITVLAVVILIAFSLIAATYFLVYYEGADSDNTDEDNNILGYKIVSVSEAYDLINQSDDGEIDLTIVDCRGYEIHVTCSDCTFRAGHIPGAERSINTLSYANTTYDILVYGKNENETKNFCTDLVNDVENVGGSVYGLEGGWDAWITHHYAHNWPPIKTGLDP